MTAGDSPLAPGVSSAGQAAQLHDRFLTLGEAADLVLAQGTLLQALHSGREAGGSVELYEVAGLVFTTAYAEWGVLDDARIAARAYLRCADAPGSTGLSAWREAVLAGEVCKARYGVNGGDLTGMRQAAARLVRASAEASPEHRPKIALVQAELMAVLADADSDPDGLRQAVTVARLARSASPLGLMRDRLTIFLGILYLHLSLATSEPGPLDECVTLLRSLGRARLCPSMRAAVTQNLVAALHVRSKGGGSADQGEIAQLMHDTSGLPRHPSSVRLLRWHGQQAAVRGDWHGAVAAWHAAALMVNELHEAQVFAVDRTRVLNLTEDALADELAFAAVRAGDFDMALESLENFRAQWADALLWDSADQLELLRVASPVLHGAYTAALRRIPDQPPDDPLAPSSRTMEIREAHQALRSLRAEIQTVPGFARFHARRSAAVLRHDARQVGIVAYASACHAGACLLLMQDGQVDATVLGGYQPDFAKLVVDRYFTGQATRDLQHFAYEALIEYVGKWLWDLLEPEVSSRVADGDSITFVLTGLFANLPLQAAYAREHDSQPGLRCYLSERFVLRVAPKVGVLLHQTGSRPASPRALVVADPWPSSAAALRWTRAESETVARLYPGSAALLGARASKARALADMPQAPVVHFACHGVFREPVEASGVLLRNDEILSASDIAGVLLAPGTVVILSACDLGFVSPTSNEGIGVPAALLCAGASSVVASVWACDDLAAALLMAEFHQILATERADPAPALQLAQHRLRHNELTSPLAPQAAGHNFSHPRFWASFACFGR